MEDLLRPSAARLILLVAPALFDSAGGRFVFHSTFPGGRREAASSAASSAALGSRHLSLEKLPLSLALSPSLSPCCRVSQPEQNQLERWQPRCTCNIIVPVMKSAPAPQGELRRVFWHADLQIYKSAAPPGLNHRLDGASAAWRPRRVANCAKKKKKKEEKKNLLQQPRWSGELLLQLLLWGFFFCGVF